MRLSLPHPVLAAARIAVRSIRYPAQVLADRLLDVEQYLAAHIEPVTEPDNHDDVFLPGKRGQSTESARVENIRQQLLASTQRPDDDALDD